jgi:general secretion pathway protein G
VLLLAITFPFLWWIYRPLILILFRFVLPIAVLAFIGYFAVRAMQLGEPAGPNENFSTSLKRAWSEFSSLFRKYFKTIALTLIVGTVVFVGSVLLYTKLSKGSDTEKQLARMSQALDKQKTQLGSYPSDLSGLIGNDPLKREWYKDTWGTSIEYTVTNNGGGYKLSSAGPDKVKGTGDDISLVK